MFFEFRRFMVGLSGKPLADSNSLSENYMRVLKNSGMSHDVLPYRKLFRNFLFAFILYGHKRDPSILLI